jgi:hypothetical protein
MRTTVDIDPSVLSQLKARARDERKTLGAVISEIAAKALAQPQAQHTVEPFDWHAKDMGTFVDLEDKDAVERALAGK